VFIEVQLAMMMILCHNFRDEEGQCTARAIGRVIGLSVPEVVAMLDTFIDEILDMERRQRIEEKKSKPQLPAWETHWTAKPGISWNISIIAKALKTHYYDNYIFQKIKINSSLVFKPGKKYLVFGEMNPNCLGPKNKKGNGPCKRYAHSNPSKSEDWEHCILVDGDMFFCECIHDLRAPRQTNMPDCAWPNKFLWRTKSGHPDRKKGYMKKIQKVYEISVSCEKKN
jgi:hypothetical protein